MKTSKGSSPARIRRRKASYSGIVNLMVRMIRRERALMIEGSANLIDTQYKKMVLRYFDLSQGQTMEMLQDCWDEAYSLA